MAMIFLKIAPIFDTWNLPYRMGAHEQTLIGSDMLFVHTEFGCLTGGLLGGGSIPCRYFGKSLVFCFNNSLSYVWRHI